METKTNGRIIRFVGQHRIPDSVWHKLSCCALFPCHLLNLCRARVVRGSWQNVCYSWFSLCERPEDRQVSVVLKVKPPSNDSATTVDKSSSSGGTGQTESKWKKELRLVAISDTHNIHERIPEFGSGDILVHTGDCTNHGSLDELKTFADWFSSQDFKLKILVPGNHDMLLDKEYYQKYYKDWGGDPGWSDIAYDYLKTKGIVVLVDQATEYNGIRFFGSPWVPQYAPWATAFNKKNMGPIWENLPECDILLTHTPPHGVGDREATGEWAGCVVLADAVRRTTPALHVFGHVHSDPGCFAAKSSKSQESVAAERLSINASSVCDFYTTRSAMDIKIALEYESPEVAGAETAATTS